MCEDCIKKDVCKYREEVEKYKSKMPEPLQPSCKYKEVEITDTTYTGTWIYPYETGTMSGYQLTI